VRRARERGGWTRRDDSSAVEAAAAPRVFTPAACAADADAAPAPGRACLAPARDARIVMRRLPRPAGPAPRGRDVPLALAWRGVPLLPPAPGGPPRAAALPLRPCLRARFAFRISEEFNILALARLVFLLAVHFSCFVPQF